MTAKSDLQEARVVDWLAGTTFPAPPANIYLALSTTATNDDGTGLTEPGFGYARQIVTLAAGSQVGGAYERSNDAEITFGPAAGGSWGTLTHGAIMDAVTAGNMLYHGPLTMSVTVSDGESARVQIGNLDISEA